MLSSNSLFLFLVIFLVGIGDAYSQNNLEGAYQLEDGGKLIVSGQTTSGFIYLRDTQSGKVNYLKQIDDLHFESADLISDQLNPVQCLFNTEAGQVDSITLNSKDGTIKNAKKIRLTEEYSYFKNDSITLYGKLVTPQGEGPFPIVIIVQGSNNSSAIKSAFMPYLLASEGIATFVYDKRGTGSSEGTYTQRFDVLAADVVAGINSIENHPKLDINRLGLLGFSQGGWVAPLAALKSGKVKYIAIGYGLIMTIAEEDLYELPIKFSAMGFRNKDLKELKDFNKTVHFIFENNFEKGWNEYKLKVNKYGNREWFKALKTTQTWSGVLLRMTIEDAMETGPNILKTFDPFYDPVSTLKKINAPMFWLFGEEDLEAPPELSIKRLNNLINVYNKPFTLKTYPGADHGMYYFVLKDNKRIKTNHPSTYLNDIISWMKKY